MDRLYRGESNLLLYRIPPREEDDTPDIDARSVGWLDEWPAISLHKGTTCRVGIALTLSPSISPLRPFLRSSSTSAVAASVLRSSHSFSSFVTMGVGETDCTLSGPKTIVSAIAVEKGEREGPLTCSKDEERVGVIGCRANGGGEDGGVRPDPEGGSSPVGDSSTEGSEKTSIGRLSSLREAGPEGASFPPSSVILVVAIRSSRIRSRIDIPYGE